MKRILPLPWNYLEFKFKDNKAAYSFARWIQFGKEIGVVPDGVELQLDTKTVLLGHFGPKDK